ncbi:conjugal transfer protein TraQ (plasmid) [Stenotrophomonas rhizophila]|uniref:conjugal transfer protein TraQ n=1 Tax=Pseudomonas monteilii TaxID=76759 RepID=UPI000E33242A|nr:conjugal transfer protein TraQ [Pseudomonas monteilii]AXQ51000.1 conjugal transfer protein TraQ [Stenotrophomonas rhizophila]MBA6105305.1 conjugal transfer protein TraQ [Pseudomonas monteilii]
MDLAQMITQFANTFAVALWRFLWVLGVLVGTVYAGSALIRLQRASRVPGASPVTVGDILPLLIIAGLLANLSRFINAAWTSFGKGTVSYGPIAYSGAAEFGRFADAINAVLTLASVFGGVAFFKGVLLLKKAVMDGQSNQGADDAVWRAITHMIFGSMLVQIPDVIDAAKASFGLVW